MIKSSLSYASKYVFWRLSNEICIRRRTTKWQLVRFWRLEPHDFNKSYT